MHRMKWRFPHEVSHPSHPSHPTQKAHRATKGVGIGLKVPHLRFENRPPRRYTHRGRYGFNMGSIMFNRGLIWFNDGLVGVKKLFGMPLAGQHTVPTVRSNDGLVGVMGFTTSGQPVNRSSMDYVP